MLVRHAAVAATALALLLGGCVSKTTGTPAAAGGSAASAPADG